MYCLCRVQLEQRDDHVTEKSLALTVFFPLNLLKTFSVGLAPEILLRKLSIVNRSKMLL